MTESFTELKGFSSFSDVDITNAIQYSIIEFFNWGFLNKGAFTNIAVGNSDLDGNNLATLRKVDDPNYTDGQVWETFHHNLVWESGLTTSVQPIKISGVYINGTLRTPTTSGYTHYIDYPRGRVIFDSAISASSVKMEYSYKTVTFDKLAVYPEVMELQLNTYNFGPGYNTASSGDWSSLLRTQMPLVAIEASPRVSYNPYSLGTGAQYVETDILMHVFDVNDTTVNKLLSFISLQKEKTIYMLDVTLMATSGAFPLDYRGTITSGTKTYEQLINGNYRSKQLRFSEARSQGLDLLQDSVYHGVVRFTTETITTV